MIRTALRLSTQAALMNGGSAPYPTLALDKVYDSRKDDITDLVAAQRFPAIIIRTDEDTRSFRDPRNLMASNAPVNREIALRIEFGILVASKVKNADGTISDTASWPQSDASLEALIDLMEWQIENALRGFATPWSIDWDFWGLYSISSMPIWANPDEGRLRRAVREMTLMVRGPFERRPKPIAVVDGPAAKAIPLPLADVIDNLARNGGGELREYATRLKARLLGQELPVSPEYPMLKSVSMQTPAPNVLGTELLDQRSTR
jgi:hypothetical protein